MRPRSLVALLAALGLAAVTRVAPAAPPPPPSSSSAKPQTGTAAGGQHQIVPDVRVNSAWIADGPVTDAWTPLPANPTVWVGETIWLGCDVGITGTIPPLAFKMAWYIDGQKTCGEGIDSLPNAPVCEFAYSITVGHKVIMSYVPHAAGAHTYRCAVDIGNQLAESNESNNSSAVLPFKALLKLSAVPKAEKVFQGVKTGPRLQGQ